jgi:phosphoglycerate dehydrogenase-like enzyme
MKPLSECHILVTPSSYGIYDKRLCTELERHVGDVTYNTTKLPLSSSQLKEILPDVDGMIAGLDRLDADTLEVTNNLRVIARYGVGVNNIDLEVAYQKGIVVTNTPGANSKSVAELTIMLILNLLRPFLQATTETRQGKWPRLKGYSLEGKKVGLIGLGSIGKEVARRLEGFDCQVLAYDIKLDNYFSLRHRVTYTSLEALLKQSDIVSLHLPLLNDTKNIVDEQFIASMKKGAWLVNTSRGELIDEGALYRALVTGHIRGVALDVFSIEPPGLDNSLINHPGVIPTPHMGSHTDGAANTMGWMALEDCLAVLRGNPPRYRIV